MNISQKICYDIKIFKYISDHVYIWGLTLMLLVANLY